MVHLEYVLPFLDPGLDRLAAVIEIEPGTQIACDRLWAVVGQGGVAFLLTGLKAFQADILLGPVRSLFTEIVQHALAAHHSHPGYCIRFVHWAC